MSDDRVDLESVQNDYDINEYSQGKFDHLVGSAPPPKTPSPIQSESIESEITPEKTLKHTEEGTLDQNAMGSQESDDAMMYSEDQQSQDIREFMKKRRKEHPKPGKRSAQPILHNLEDRNLCGSQVQSYTGQSSPAKGNVKYKKTAAPKRESREERLRRELEAEEAERTKLKTIMIGICTFLEQKYQENIHKIALERDPNLYYDIHLDLLEFLYHFPFEGSRFHEYPKEFLKFLKQCFIAVQSKIIQHENDESVRQFMVLKRRLNVRLTNVPPIAEITLGTLRNLRQCHVNKYMVIYGTVVRAQTVKNRETKKDFACKNCGKIYSAQSDIYEFSRFLLPPVCGGQVEKKPNPFQSYIMNMKRRRGQKTDGEDLEGNAVSGNTLGQCNNRQFIPVHGTAQYKDYQEIKIQEVYKTLKPGVIPRSSIVILEDNLVDLVKPGDDVMISGLFIQRWQPPFNRTDRPQIEVAVLANNITVLNKREFNIKQEINQQACSEFKRYWKDHDYNPIIGKNKILESIAPHLYDRYDVKLGLLLSIIGGVPKQCGDDPRIRGQIHMLMIGEPGTGKSQLLQFAQKISMRSVNTTGIGTTSAGLTVAAFKDGNDWILEAGALVLADCGVCCIDEFALIKPEDRGSVHEAMEQQTISIAKAGICCKINTRATILAATNPNRTQKWNSRYDNNQNTGIASSLLSRFDLIFILVDAQSTEQDLAQSNFKLTFSRQEEDLIDETKASWSSEKLMKYIVFIQRYIDPVCSEESEMIFQAYFSYLRGRTTLAKDRKTIRMLESLIRLAEAHARLMFRKDIEIFDAVNIVILMECCVNTGLYDNNYSCLMSRQMYAQAKQETLMKLGLDPRFFQDDDFDVQTEEPVKLLGERRAHRPQKNPANRMGEDTMFNLGYDETHLQTNTYTAIDGMQSGTYVPQQTSTNVGVTNLDISEHHLTQNTSFEPTHAENTHVNTSSRREVNTCNENTVVVLDDESEGNSQEDNDNRSEVPPSPCYPTDSVPPSPLYPSDGPTYPAQSIYDQQPRQNMYPAPIPTPGSVHSINSMHTINQPQNMFQNLQPNQNYNPNFQAYQQSPQQNNQHQNQQNFQNHQQPHIQAHQQPRQQNYPPPMPSPGVQQMTRPPVQYNANNNDDVMSEGQYQQQGITPVKSAMKRPNIGPDRSSYFTGSQERQQQGTMTPVIQGDFGQLAQKPEPNLNFDNFNLYQEPAGSNSKAEVVSVSRVEQNDTDDEDTTQYANDLQSCNSGLHSFQQKAPLPDSQSSAPKRKRRGFS